MSKKFNVGIILLLCFAVLCITGCKKNSGSGTAASKKPVASVGVSQQVTASEDVDVPAVNIDALDELKGIPLSAVNGAHNLYRGTFGNEEVILALWMDKEAEQVEISCVGAYHSEKMSYSCELLEDGVRFQDDDYYILLKQQKDDVLKGYYYEKGLQLVKVNLKLEAINYGGDKEHLYPIGENDEVEEFAQKVLDSINACDFKAFSNYVSFPVSVHVNQAVQTIETKEDFLALGDEVIFTDDFVAAMAVTYPNLMFCNGTDGAMLGDGQYNVWLNTDEKGQLKVTAINN